MYWNFTAHFEGSFQNGFYDATPARTKQSINRLGGGYYSNWILRDRPVNLSVEGWFRARFRYLKSKRKYISRNVKEALPQHCPPLSCRSDSPSSFLHLIRTQRDICRTESVYMSHFNVDSASESFKNNTSPPGKSGEPTFKDDASSSSELTVVNIYKVARLHVEEIVLSARLFKSCIFWSLAPATGNFRCEESGFIYIYQHEAHQRKSGKVFMKILAWKQLNHFL